MKRKRLRFVPPLLFAVLGVASVALTFGIKPLFFEGKISLDLGGIMPYEWLMVAGISIIIYAIYSGSLSVGILEAWKRGGPEKVFTSFLLFLLYLIFFNLVMGLLIMAVSYGIYNSFGTKIFLLRYDGIFFWSLCVIGSSLTFVYFFYRYSVSTMYRFNIPHNYKEKRATETSLRVAFALLEAALIALIFSMKTFFAEGIVSFSAVGWHEWAIVILFGLITYFLYDKTFMVELRNQPGSVLILTLVGCILGFLFCHFIFKTFTGTFLIFNAENEMVQMALWDMYVVICSVIYFPLYYDLLTKIAFKPKMSEAVQG